MNKDAINPKHYNAGDVYEHRKVVDAWGLDYQLGCATKYLCRMGKKESADPIEDARKAIRYIEFEIEKLEGTMPAMNRKQTRATCSRCEEYKAVRGWKDTVYGVICQKCQKEIADEEANQTKKEIKKDDT